MVFYGRRVLAEFPSRRPQGYIDQRLRYAERCGVREIRGQEAENAFKNRTRSSPMPDPATE